jgi:hypothetical protein
MRTNPFSWQKLLGAGVALALAVGLIFIAQSAIRASASGLAQAVPTATNDPNLSIGNDTCLQCHGQPGTTMPLEDGSILELYVAPDEYNASVHGLDGYACVQCHTTVGNYPHPPFSAKDARDVSLQLYTACKLCHASQYELASNSVHAMAIAEGNREGATCVDCHGAHNVQAIHNKQTGEILPETHQWITETCSKCHNAIYEKYTTSVHGAALLEENNPDVPTCINCHGVHNIPDPTTAAFRLRSPQICSKCHTDPEIAGKYGLSTNVLNSYVADFHGTTVTLFEKRSPDAETNKAVCYDCHGIHDIQSTKDPTTGLQLRENLLARCKSCHPDATSNFPASWLSHYEPSPERFPMVYYVNLFYKFFIPAVLGGMGVLVALDLYKRTTLLASKIKPTPPKPAPEASEVEKNPEEAQHE